MGVRHSLTYSAGDASVVGQAVPDCRAGRVGDRNCGLLCWIWGVGGGFVVRCQAQPDLLGGCFFDVSEPERALCFGSPVGLIVTLGHATMKRRMRPVSRSPDQGMLDRIVMHVVKVPFKIEFVSNQVLPETTLPNPAASLPGL